MPKVHSIIVFILMDLIDLTDLMDLMFILMEGIQPNSHGWA